MTQATMIDINVQSDSSLPLLPSQSAILTELEQRLAVSPIVVLIGRAEQGKSHIARCLGGRIGADYIDASDYFVTLDQEPADRWDERVFDMIEARLSHADTLIIDDYTFLISTESSGRSKSYNRYRAEQLRIKAMEAGKRLVLVGGTHAPREDEQNAHNSDEISWLYGNGSSSRDAVWSAVPRIEMTIGLEPEDYKALLVQFLGNEAAKIDVETMHYHAPGLSIPQIRLACRLLSSNEISTAALIQVIGEHILRDNLRLAEVEALSFDQLPGSEHIARALETHVVLPFENPELARRRGIKAKRGVMIFGPPGTGKTAIGRALARRLEGRFYLIDGTISTEPSHGFMMRVTAIIRQAIKNAPCVLFIDDADNLFSIPHVAGIVRYLLSLLDGLESENANKVCVMMTVMDAAKVPDALTRSGRVELWLETVSPEVKMRGAILRRWTSSTLPGADGIDYDHLASLTDGLVPADLRRIMDDVRLLYARDVRDGTSPQPVMDYAERAVRDLRSMRARMSQILEGVAA
jgi:transitional endoplasmic reticulum ATPase